MPLQPGERRVNREHPCPVCGKDHWCVFDATGLWVICARVESDMAYRYGWLHRLGERVEFTGPAPVEIRRSHDEWAEMWRKRLRFTTTRDRNRLADELGVSVESLDAFGYAVDGTGWSLPMRDGDLSICGLQLRLRDGRKLCVKGSRSGIFVPTLERSAGGPLFIAEGASDAAAMLTCGVDAIGRYSCGASEEQIVSLTRRHPRPAVVVADRNKVGMEGAARLARLIGAKWATAPDKDFRKTLWSRGVQEARRWLLSTA